MVRFNFLLTGILCLVNSIVAAQTSLLVPLRKGDTAPNISLAISINNNVQKIHLYDLHKKLILFDFWSINCSSCILQMPHLLELQEKFNKDIQVIIVTKNSRVEVNRLKERIQGHVSKEISNALNHLPFLMGDSILSIIFPHEGFPIHVWLDSLKTLRAVAYSNTTTDESVKSFLTGGKIRLAEQGLQNIDHLNPISWLDADTGFISHLKYYSFILSRVEHIGGFDGQVFASFDSTTGKVIAFNIVNSSIANLYKLAYFKYEHPNIGIPDSKILLETKNNSRFYPPRNELNYYSWADSNLYSYAIKLPPKNADSIYMLMRMDLDKFFKLKSKFEYRKVKCIILTKTNSFENLHSVSKVSRNEIDIDSTGTWMILQNQPIALLASRIESLVNYYDTYQPFFDETNLDENIDIVLPWNNELQEISMDRLKKSLNDHGLDIKEENKFLKMLVLSDD